MMKQGTHFARVFAGFAFLALGMAAMASDDEHAASPPTASSHEIVGTHEAGHDEGHEEPSLFAGDLGNTVWTLVIFVILLVLLGKFAWPQILGGLQKREEFIRESLESAKRDREAAEDRLKEYEARIHAARAEASAIVEEGRRDAEALKRKLDETAKAERETELQRAKREIQLAKETAIKELYESSADMAVQIASRLIRKELDAKQHQQLIADAISSVGSRN